MTPIDQNDQNDQNDQPGSVSEDSASRAHEPGPVLVVECHRDVAEAMTHDLELLLGDGTEVVTAADGEEALVLARALAADGRPPVVAFIERTLPGMSGADLALALQRDRALWRTRCVLITSRTSLYEVDDALVRGALHGMLNRPWSALGLRDQLRAQLATYYVEHDPDVLEQYRLLIDDHALERARQRLAERRRVRSVPVGDGDHVLLAPRLEAKETHRRFVAALDQALGHPPRLRVGPGSVLLEQGVDVGGIYVVLAGQIKLCRRTDSGEQVVQADATGPIVGLLSLASKQRAFFEVRTVTEVRAIPLTLGQLSQALLVEPELGALLTRLLVDSLAGRLREAAELQMRIDRLAASLAEDRDQLAEALAALKQAQSDLIGQARMATLGELAAGIAHELNNPTAAIARSADHVAVDIAALLAPDDPAGAAMERALQAEPLSAAAAREGRRALVEAVGDRVVAERLWTAGVVDPDQGVALAALDDSRLERLTAGNRLGSGLRNLTTAAARIGDLVDSLRAYLQGGDQSPMVADVSVVDTVEDALRLMGHRLGEIDVVRHYEPVPVVVAQPGRLQQVWTNVVTNAVDAIEQAGDDQGGTGTRGLIELRIERRGADGVRVEVVDNGPGIADDVIEHMFTPRFTTKHGRVRFGSGLGLSIVRQIVEDHNGTISVTSEPGRTVFAVILPLDPREDRPPAGQDQDLDQGQGDRRYEGERT